MPQYDPSLNNDPAYLRLVTCYGYAALNIQKNELPALELLAYGWSLQRKVWGGPQPGMLAAHINPGEKQSVPRNTDPLDYFRKMALRDGLLQYEGNDFPPVRRGYYRVAVMCERWNPSKIHVARGDEASVDGAIAENIGWSHKYGQEEISQIDDAGKEIIGDPRKATWVRYPDFCAFYYAPVKRPYFDARTLTQVSRIPGLSTSVQQKPGS